MGTQGLGSCLGACLAILDGIQSWRITTVYLDWALGRFIWVYGFKALIYCCILC